MEEKMPSKSDELGIFTGSKNMSIIEAMERIDKNTKGILYILEDDGRLYGSLTDGTSEDGYLEQAVLRAGQQMLQTKAPRRSRKKREIKL